MKIYLIPLSVVVVVVAVVLEMKHAKCDINSKSYFFHTLKLCIYKRRKESFTFTSRRRRRK